MHALWLNRMLVSIKFYGQARSGAMSRLSWLPPRAHARRKSARRGKSTTRVATLVILN